MKKLKQGMLSLLCVMVMLGTTACGSRNNTDNTTPNDSNMNNATEGVYDNNTTTTDSNYNNNATNGNGVVDDLGDAVGEGINDIGNGVENITDDITGNDNHMNDTNNTNNK